MDVQSPPLPSSEPAPERRRPSTTTAAVLGYLGAGDQAGAVAVIQERYARAFFAFFLRMQPHEADDLLQQFFVVLLEPKVLAGYDTSRGPLREYLRGIARHVSAGARKKTHAPGRQQLSIDVVMREKLAASTDPPDVILDREWLNAAIAAGVQAVAANLRQSGRPIVASVFLDYYDKSQDGLTYRVLADRHGCSEADVGNYLREARGQLHEFLVLEYGPDIDER